MTPSWYDVLDVAPDADPETIRAAFRAAIADLDPTDRRFKLASRAAEVLLDDDRRAAHDAELAAAEPEPDLLVEPEPVVVPEPASETPSADTADTRPDLSKADAPVSRRAGRQGDAPKDRPRRPKPAAPRVAARPESTSVPVVTVARTGTQGRARRLRWSTVLAAVLAAVLLAGVVVSLVNGGEPAEELPDDRQVAAARAAAEAAVEPVLSYDYRHLPADKEKALAYLTPRYAEEYGKLFDGLIDENSPTTRTVVATRLLASGISRTGPGRVDVVVFFDQVTTNREVTADDPVVYKNQAVAQMVDVDGTWLLDCLLTAPGASCGE